MTEMHLIGADQVEQIFMAWVDDLVTNHGDRSVAQVLASPTFQSMFTADIGQSASTVGGQCSLCKIPLATGDCSHGLFTEDQVTMARKRWESMVDEIQQARLVATEPEPSAIEVGGVRMEYDSGKSAEAIHDLASAVRFHALVTGPPLTNETMNAFREISR